MVPVETYVNCQLCYLNFCSVTCSRFMNYWNNRINIAHIKRIYVIDNKIQIKRKVKIWIIILIFFNSVVYLYNFNNFSLYNAMIEVVSTTLRLPDMSHIYSTEFKFDDCADQCKRKQWHYNFPEKYDSWSERTSWTCGGTNGSRIRFL